MRKEKYILENNNIFKGECNLLEHRLEILITQFRNATSRDYKMKNIGTILKNRCHELNQEFDILDEYYLERYSLKEEIIKKLLIYLIASEKHLKKLQDNFNKFDKYSSIIGLNLYINNVYKKIIDEYNSCCDAIENYDINSNLKEILVSRYNNLQFKILGYYTKTYLKDRIILTSLGYSEQLEIITPQIVQLIEKKETEISNNLQNELNISYCELKKVLKNVNNP